MKIIVAQTAGFCMGVRRAVEAALAAPQQRQEPIYTYGPLIHNPHVLALLASKGIRVLERIPEHGAGTVLIRAHGVPRRDKERLKQAGFTVIDATCPRVIRVQSIIRHHAKRGCATIILGDRDHPEVVGLLGHAGDKGVVVASLEELAALPAYDCAIIVAQTTQHLELFEAVKTWAARRRPHYKLFDTICDSTARRQTEIRQLAAQADAVIVVGGRDSGNTRRLAQIAAESGTPAVHIETEAELDPAVLAEAGTVAVTAGASTPNWIITGVLRAIEKLPSNREPAWKSALFTLQRVLLLTNLYLAAGAGALCWACIRLQGLPRALPHVWIAMLYVQSMHLLNHLTGTRADSYNDPERAQFYNRHRTWLGLTAALAGAAGLATASTTGLLPFGVLLVMSLLGLSYNLKIVPRGALGGRIRRIKDIPGSKTVLIALAWGLVTAGLPALSASPMRSVTALVVAFLVSTALVFVRTAFFDLLDIQGDRIVGKETLPILLGERRTLRLLYAALAGTALLLTCSAALGLVSSLGGWLALCPACSGAVLAAHDRGRFLPGIRLEFAIETNFMLAGVLTLLWRML
jgi:4-hydroxy-3-methylbut-2-enyl diphosphate reductase